MRKIIPLILILLVILPVGLFGFVPEAEAAESCWVWEGGILVNFGTVAGNKTECDKINGYWGEQSTAPANTETDFEDNLEACFSILRGSIAGCFQQLIYILFVQLPSWLLIVVAKFFNFMAGVTLSSDFYGADFIEKIWIIIRDFANIFFILVLLYAAFQIILDIGHGGGKKIIASVILMALLVNFSLFFTKVVIDASNVVALIFYNRIDISNVNNYDNVGNVPGIPEKDMAGALVSSFNVNKFFDDKLMQQLRNPQLSWKFTPLLLGLPLPTIQYFNPYTMMGMMVVYGLVIYALCYAFLIAALSFLGRMLMLMMLMMVSPLAFVSLAVPGLKSVETIGFDSWIKNLIKSAFVAAIFIFIIYIISIILKAKIFDQLADGGTKGPIDILILLFVPAVMIVILLVKGAAYAREASGKFSGAVISGAKVVGSLALGGAALGTAVVGRSTVGAFMKGASTGDSINQRYARGDITRAGFRAGWRGDLAYRAELAKGAIAHYGTGTLVTRAQTGVGNYVNRDQHDVAHAAHSRHDLDEAANAVTHGAKKKWNDLNGDERFEARRKIARDRAVRENAGDETRPGTPAPLFGFGYRFGNRKWESLSPQERDQIDAAIGAVHGQITPGGYAAQHTDELIGAARRKQGLGSTLLQSTVTGGYDVRKLADVIAKEQSTGFAKITAGLTGALASGLRGGFKQMGVNYGTPQGAFFKDLGNTITEALKSAKINVDLSHVGEEKKEGGGGGHH